MRKAVKERLVRGEVRGSHATDEEIEEAAIERGAAVQTLHRKGVAESQSIVTILQSQLREAATI